MKKKRRCRKQYVKMPGGRKLTAPPPIGVWLHQALYLRPPKVHLHTPHARTTSRARSWGRNRKLVGADIRNLLRDTTMAQAFPYTYYACDCFDSNNVTATKQTSHVLAATDDEEETLDPRNPRSNFALYPLEHLLYCEDCLQIRCPRCVIEETLNWYCPNCLFEVPSSVVKSDGNRCTRNCFNCPVCISPSTLR